MLTVDYRRLELEPGHLLLDMGAGAGRHAFESYRRGANVVAADLSQADLKDVQALMVAMAEAGEERRAPAENRAPERRDEEQQLPA